MPSSDTARMISRSCPMMRAARACSFCTAGGAETSTATSGPSMPCPVSSSRCCTPSRLSRSARARVNSSRSVGKSAFASRSEKKRMVTGASTGAPYRMPRRTQTAEHGSFCAMLRDLSGEERTAYFRGIQPIWGGGLGEERFEGFQRRLADAAEAQGRYRLLGWFEHGGLAAAMKAYHLRGACAGRSLRLLGIGAVFTPPALRRRGHAAAMLRAAMDEYRREGAQAAVLFSDID